MVRAIQLLGIDNCLIVLRDFFSLRTLYADKIRQNLASEGLGSDVLINSLFYFFTR
jgi:hypothetical protein